MEIDRADFSQSENTILVDTDIFSYWIKGDTRGDPYYPYSVSKKITLSFASIAELYYWEYNKNWGSKIIAKLEQKISECVILPANNDVCREFSIIRFQLKNSPIGYIDYWIAACAKSYKCPILTNNHSYFSRIKGIKLLGPYSNLINSWHQPFRGLRSFALILPFLSECQPSTSNRDLASNG